MDLFGQTQSNISRSASVLGAVGLSAIALSLLTQPANAASVLLGSDYFVTQPGTRFNFGPGIGEVFFQGNPIGTFQGRNVGNADTIVQRLNDVSLPTVGSSGTSPIQVAALSLKSVSPINGFDVFVNLNPNTPSLGTININHSNPDSAPTQGTFSSNFTVNFTATFQPQGGGNPIPCPIASCDFQTAFTASSGQWSHTFQGGTRVVGPVGDVVANVHTNPPAGFGDFYLRGNITHEHASFAGLAGQHTVSPTVPVPEPVSTLLGSFLALGSGVALKKAYSRKSKQNLNIS